MVYPEKAAKEKIIIYLHGGVYALGSVHSHGALVSHIANKLNTTLLFVDYSLAPEHPYPAANNEVYAVYDALLKDYPGYRIGFIGDSAGGGLIISTIAKALEQKLELPEAVAMLSPWIDLEGSNPSFEYNKAKDPVLNTGLIANATKDYLAGAAIETANPKNAVLSAFPQVMIVVGTNEVLEDDSKNFFTSIKKIQPNSTLTIYEDQTHVWPLSNISSDASQRLLTELDEFFNQ